MRLTAAILFPEDCWPDSQIYGQPMELQPTFSRPAAVTLLGTNAGTKI